MDTAAPLRGARSGRHGRRAAWCRAAAPLATPGRATPGSVAARLPRAGQRRDLHRIDGGGRPADARATRFPVSRPDSVPPLLHRPHTEVYCPRNALLGHLMGALAGPTSLTMFGLWRHGPALYRMTRADLRCGPIARVDRGSDDLGGYSASTGRGHHRWGDRATSSVLEQVAERFVGEQLIALTAQERVDRALR